MRKILYGMLVSELLDIKKFKKEIEGIGFKVNPHNAYISNQIIDGG